MISAIIAALKYRESLKGRTLTTRLLDLGKPNAEMGRRLYLSIDLPVDTEYATLSHCWGSSATFTMTRNNLLTLHKSVPLKELSKTFQEAILAARHLGFQYPWIDSLCIVQGDIEDWRGEGSAMSIVYGNSSLTIAATDAKDGTMGLFFNRNPTRINPCRIKAAGGQVYACYFGWEIYNGMSENPLRRQAWAFQARFLSTRMLSLTSSQLV